MSLANYPLVTGLWRLVLCGARRAALRRTRHVVALAAQAPDRVPRLGRKVATRKLDGDFRVEVRIIEPAQVNEREHLLCDAHRAPWQSQDPLGPGLPQLGA